jgi:hypothetical protein
LLFSGRAGRSEIGRYQADATRACLMDLDVEVRYPSLVHDRHDLTDAE